MNILLGMLLLITSFYTIDGTTYKCVEAGQFGRPYFFEAISLEEQIAMEVYDGEREELAQLVQAEAGNQGLEGKRLVVDCVLNRVEDPDFPNSIHEVIFQKGQFKVMENGAFDKAGWNMTEEDFKAVAIETEGPQLNEDVLYFSRGKGPYGHDWFKEGDHWFGSK